MISHHDVLIVGAGHAGAQASIALRQRGYGGTIAIVGDEPELPYERPPLSKDYLSGDKPFDRILIRPAAFWAERRITMLLGRRAIAIDAAGHVLTLQDGEVLHYGTLIWAAGGTPRSLVCAGHALAGVHSVRTRADVDRLSAELASQPRVVVIGGGYIGLEAAAVLAKRGLSVTLLETQSRVLARVAGEPLSIFYEQAHRAAGVDLRTGVTVSCIEGSDRVTGVRLDDGGVLPAELVIVGIGIVPAVEPLIAAGAEGGNGVMVDEFCRTSLPDIYAIGDCAAHANVYAGGAVIRLESVQNAVDQATTAARDIVNDAAPYRSVPWFWSNQYDLRLQTVGLSTGHDLAIVRGDPARRSFSVAYFKEGRLQALDCVNAAKDFVQGKALVAAGLAIAPELIANADVPLKELHRQAASDGIV